MPAMVPTPDVIAELTAMIWSTTLNMEMLPSDDTDPEGWPFPSVEAQVHITGSWNGVVAIHTSEQLAARVARQMLNLGRRNPTAEDIQDAFGEVANMTGGNIKGLMSESDAVMSLPSVVMGRDYSVRVPRTRQVAHYTFRCGDDPFVITLLEAIS
jgi:chemotaxis protein CheX